MKMPVIEIVMNRGISSARPIFTSGDCQNHSCLEYVTQKGNRLVYTESKLTVEDNDQGAMLYHVQTTLDRMPDGSYNAVSEYIDGYSFPDSPITITEPECGDPSDVFELEGLRLHYGDGGLLGYTQYIIEPSKYTTPNRKMMHQPTELIVARPNSLGQTRYYEVERVYVDGYGHCWRVHLVTLVPQTKTFGIKDRSHFRKQYIYVGSSHIYDYDGMMQSVLTCSKLPSSYGVIQGHLRLTMRERGSLY